MSELADIIDSYIELEIAVQERINSLFSNICASCTACCCRVDICEETVHSVFLSKLIKMQECSADIDDRYGWLNTDGCSLKFGRPPVCYTYFCDELLARLPDENGQFVSRILGRLIEYVGENALGDQHLTEIENPKEFERIQTAQIQQRLESAQNALNIIDGFFEAGRLPLSDREALLEIGLPEE